MSCLVVGNHTQGLAIVRSLGRCGVPVHVLYDKHVCLSRFSRYAKGFNLTQRGILGEVFLPQRHERLLEDMLRVVPKGEKWPLLGVNEDLIQFFYQEQETLREKFLFPENEIEQIIDKFQFAKNTSQAGIPTPRTYLMSEIKQGDMAGRAFVAKGRIGNKFRAISNIKGLRLERYEDLERIRSHIAGKLNEDEVIIQEIVEGENNIQSCCGFAVDGTPMACFMYEKLRQGPDRFGTGTFCKSLFVPELLGYAQTFLAMTNYTGIFEIEFLKGGEDGQFYAIEMNPRAWKSIDLSCASGQNLCLLYYEYLKHGTLPKHTLTFTEDKYWAHLVSDVYYTLRKGSLRFNYRRGMVFCDFAWDDMKPFLAECALLPLLALKV